MATTGYSNVGEEWAQKFAWRQDTITRDTTAEILLFDDSTDATSDTSDIGDITTEPTDGNYDGGDLRISGTVTFDVDNTTGTVDAWGAVNDFQSDVVNSEAGANPHLLATATFDTGSQDLTNFTSLDVTINLDLN